MEKERTYLCIDLKSFYASVECLERNLDPFTTNLVVADPERSDKTICLAVSPAMKKLGVPGRCRVFEIPPNIEYIMAPPRMQLYIDYSARIYGIYLKYIAKEDIHPYSIDEIMADVTDYLVMYQMTGQELAELILRDVLETTGITATCGVGTNLYLAKIAMDIVAKRAGIVTADGKHRFPVGILNEVSYCALLWDHRPLTDFWRVGKGTAKRLAGMGIYTMKDIACANEDILYKVFGIDAELLIDHAWGRESTTMADIKHYRPKANSLSSGQVLGQDYRYEKGLLVVKEMADLLCLDLVDKGLVTNSITLTVGYGNRYEKKPAHGTVTLTATTSSARRILPYVEQLYTRIVDPHTPIRRITLCYNNVIEELYRQYDLFSDPAELEREHRLQVALLQIKDRYGKNAMLKGMNLLEGATTRERNGQIGGHKA